MKKVLLLIISIFCFIYTNAQSGTNFTDNGINYRIIDATTAKVTSSSCHTGALTLDTVVYNGTSYAITLIGESAFEACTTITSLTIGDSVTSIEDFAFVSSSALTSVTIGNSVTTIGYAAFNACTALTSVTFGDSVTTLGDFSFCNALTSITIPNSVTTMGYSVFRDCAALTSVIIGDSVTSIGGDAFSNCHVLTSVTIGESVSTIGDAAFMFCTALSSVIIPDSVTIIGLSAFERCTALTSVTIGASVTTFEAYAFRNCTALTSVTIPSSVTRIDNASFLDCTALTSVKSYVPTPLEIDLSVFEGDYQANCDLYVLPSSHSDYMAADVWKDFRSTGTLGTSNISITNQVTVYPNPASNHIIINLETGLALESVHFYNVLGQLVKKAITKEIPVSDLSTGTYFVEIQTNKGKGTKSIIIE